MKWSIVLISHLTALSELERPYTVHISLLATGNNQASIVRLGGLRGEQNESILKRTYKNVPTLVAYEKKISEILMNIKSQILKGISFVFYLIDN